MLDISIKEAFPVISNASNFNFNFKKANYAQLNEYLMSVDWDNKLNCDGDCEEMVDVLYDVWYCVLASKNMFLLKTIKPQIALLGLVEILHI